MLSYNSHAQERAMERFGIYLTIEDITKLVERIHEGDAEYIGRGKRKTSIWCIEYDGQKLYPLVDFDDRFILTFLTKTMAYKTAKKQRLLAKQSQIDYN